MIEPKDTAKIRKLADGLIACNPSEFWDELNALSKDECAYLDSIAFECTICNQWFATAERRGEHEWVCKDCDE